MLWMLHSFLLVIPRRLSFMFPHFGTPCPFHLCRPLSFLFTRHMKREQNVPKRRHLQFKRLGIIQKTEYNKPNECSCFSSLWYWVLSRVSSSQETLLFSACLLTNIPFFCDVTLRDWRSCSRRFERTWRLRPQAYMVMSWHTVVLDWTAVTTSQLAPLFLHIPRQLQSEDRFYFLLPVCYLNSHDI